MFSYHGVSLGKPSEIDMWWQNSLILFTSGRKTAAGFFCFWRLATNSPFPGSDSQLSALTDLPPTLTTKDLKTSPFVAIIVKLWLREESSKHERLTATLSENPPCSRRWGFNSHILHQIPTGEFDKIQFPRHHKYFLNHWNVAPPLQEAVEDDQVWTKTSCLPGCTQLYLGSSSSPFDAQSRVTRFGNKSDSSQLGHWKIQTTQIDSGPKLCRAD